jgi:TolA-binding protein
MRTLLLTLFLLLSAVSFGQTKEELQRQKVLLQDQIELASDILKKTQSSRAASLTELETLNQKIEAREKLIRTMSRQIRRIDREVSKTESDIQRLESGLCPPHRTGTAKPAAHRPDSIYPELILVCPGRETDPVL